MQFGEEQLKALDTLEAQAIAYVWGWQDATGKGAKDTGWSTEFGAAYRLHAERYMSELIGYRHTIADAHCAYRNGQPIETPYGELIRNV